MRKFSNLAEDWPINSIQYGQKFVYYWRVYYYLWPMGVYRQRAVLTPGDSCMENSPGIGGIDGPSSGPFLSLIPGQSRHLHSSVGWSESALFAIFKMGTLLPIKFIYTSSNPKKTANLVKNARSKMFIFKESKFLRPCANLKSTLTREILELGS